MVIYMHYLIVIIAIVLYLFFYFPDIKCISVWADVCVGVVCGKDCCEKRMSVI